MIAKAHPDLTLILDHIGLNQTPGPVAADPWADLPLVLALAEHANIAVKLCGANTLSHEPFPYHDVWRHLHPLIDAFGANRLMWASDFTRQRLAQGSLNRGRRDQWSGIYSDSLTFLRDSEELSNDEKQYILGGTIRSLLRWPKPEFSSDVVALDEGIHALLPRQ
jgi:predicted TIM-barrel fold metal-dependent hydrolase